MLNLREVWKTWQYALGSFEDKTTKDYDNKVTVIRTFILIWYLVTNSFIVAGVLRHW
jgi:hypothetical protein